MLRQYECLFLFVVIVLFCFLAMIRVCEEKNRNGDNVRNFYEGQRILRKLNKLWNFLGDILFMRTQTFINIIGKLTGLDEVNRFSLPQTKRVCVFVFFNFSGALLFFFFVEETTQKEISNCFGLTRSLFFFPLISITFCCCSYAFLSSDSSLLKIALFALDLCLQLAQGKQSCFCNLLRDSQCQGCSLTTLMSAHWSIWALTEVVEQGHRAMMK